jgi:hypothetical protein
MAFYTVLTPPPDPRASTGDQMEKTIFLKDGFTLFAFVFTGLWLLSKRLWLAFAIFVVIWAAIGFGGRYIGFNPLALALAQALIGGYLGLEGNALLERKLLKQGWTLAGVVEGRDLDAVERRFFEQHRAEPQRPAMPLAAASLTAAGPRPDVQPVTGLFPDPQRR